MKKKRKDGMQVSLTNINEEGGQGPPPLGGEVKRQNPTKWEVVKEKKGGDNVQVSVPDIK